MPKTSSNMKTSHLPGFTLVEILVVLAIIGVLAGLLLTNFVGVRERAGDAKVKNDLRQLKTALRLYYNDFNQYPDVSGAAIAGCGTDGDAACTTEFSADGTVYMKELPAGFTYYSDGLDSFILESSLQNLSDEEIANSVTRCDPAGASYFTGTVDDGDYFVCAD